MKTTLSRIFLSIFLLFTFSNTTTHAATKPFFLKEVVKDSAIEDRFSQIKISGGKFKNEETNARLSESRIFVGQVKREALKRYKDGKLSRYEIDDIARELEYLTYSMNQYFENMKSYERNRKSLYLDLANTNLVNAASSYDRLSGITWGTVRK